MSNEICAAYAALKTRLVDDPPAGVNVYENVGGVLGVGDLPRIDIFGLMNLRGEDIDMALHGRAGVQISVVIRLLEDPQYGLTNADHTRGILWLLEEALDKIYGSDHIASGAWGKVPNVRIIGSTINETAYSLDIEVQITSARFTRGGL